MKDKEQDALIDVLDFIRIFKSADGMFDANRALRCMLIAFSSILSEIEVEDGKKALNVFSRKFNQMMEQQGNPLRIDVTTKEGE